MDSGDDIEEQRVQCLCDAAYDNGLETAIEIVLEMMDNDGLRQTLVCGLENSKKNYKSVWHILLFIPSDICHRNSFSILET